MRDKLKFVEHYSLGKSGTVAVKYGKRLGRWMKKNFDNYCGLEQALRGTGVALTKIRLLAT